MPSKNEKNLKPVRSKSEARERGKKGGIASGKVRREKSALRDVAKMVLAAQIPSDKVEEGVRLMGLPETELNMRTAMLAGMATAAARGNVRAAEYLLELGGESATDEQNKIGMYAGLPARVLGKAFVDIYRDIIDRKYRYFDFRGGRGSLKSSFCALELVDELERNPQFCAIAIRQIKDTLKDSVYAQIVWAIDELGLSEKYHCTVSPMQIKRIDTGQIIYFRGADDPIKLKSIRPPKDMHIGAIWVEEADQIAGDAALRSIYQSTMRGGDDVVVMRSYNTPISMQHYINKDALNDKPDRIIHHSYYYDAPRAWLGKPFFDAAEELKALDDLAYRHEYLGEATGTGGSVFRNVELREIETAEWESLPTYSGHDFGFARDPDAFIRCAYDRKRRILYIVAEFVSCGMMHDALAKEVKKRCRRDIVTADSAEPRSIEEMRARGIQIIGAKKGPDSVSHGIRWLQTQCKIVIDKKSCPTAAKEFSAYEYERNRDGEFISRYPDHNNHTIDAVRYAMESVSARRAAIAVE